jgi:hypothetical protein
VETQMQGIIILIIKKEWSYTSTPPLDLNITFITGMFYTPGRPMKRCICNF